MKSLIKACVLICLIAGCAPKKENIAKIAVAVPLTGDVAAIGQGIKNAVALAIEEANSSGIFSTTTRKSVVLQLAAFDDRADPKEAVNVANQIITDKKIFAVIGHVNSGCSIPAAIVYSQKNLLMISPASTNPKLTLQQTEPTWKYVRNIFRICTTDDVQGSFAAKFIAEKLKLNTAAVIHDKTPYGQGLAEEFVKEFKKLQGKELSFDGIAMGEKDFKALLTRIKASKPEVIYFGGIYTEGGLILRQARELGLKAIFISGDACCSPEFVKVAGKYSEGAYITMVGVPAEKLPAAKDFIEKFKAKYPGVDLQPFDHYGYEAANIIITAIKEVGLDKKKIINAVRKIKFRGVLGETSFDEKGDTTNKAISVYQVKQGNFIPIE